MLCIVKHKRAEFYLHSMDKITAFCGGVSCFIANKLFLFSSIESSVHFRIVADIFDEYDLFSHLCIV